MGQIEPVLAVHTADFRTLVGNSVDQPDMRSNPRTTDREYWRLDFVWLSPIYPTGPEEERQRYLIPVRESPLANVNQNH